MFGTLTSLTGTSPQFLPGNSFSAAGVSTSGSHSKMPFAARNPSGNCKVQAIAGTAARVKSTKPANLYQILRITETASPIEIKTAYRSLAKVYHPDASSESSDCGDFIEIHNAYATLSDPTARARYDLAIGARTRFRYSAGIRPHFGQTMRWETDQCW